MRNRRRKTLILALLLTACTVDPTTLPLSATATPSLTAGETTPVPMTLTTEALLTTETATLSPEDPHQEIREAMVAETIESRGVTDPGVLQAMRNVPRHEFVPEAYVNQAYEDHPLPIGYGQTISQPYIVAWMTELLDLQPGERVLEIGTGSGYQAAVLAELEGIEVFTIEIVPELAELAAERLDAAAYSHVTTRQGDGYYGWPEHAPYDAIIVTAAPDHLPQPLVAQLTEGGRLVIPIGPPGSYQNLWRFAYENGELRAENMGGVIFVPFTGEGTEDE
jgi:protein-L-isoaspartate(D-aspartate) O-methyltransferase